MHFIDGLYVKDRFVPHLWDRGLIVLFQTYLPSFCKGNSASDSLSPFVLFPEKCKHLSVDSKYLALTVCRNKNYIWPVGLAK